MTPEQLNEARAKIAAMHNDPWSPWSERPSADEIVEVAIDNFRQALSTILQEHPNG